MMLLLLHIVCVSSKLAQPAYSSWNITPVAGIGLATVGWKVGRRKKLPSEALQGWLKETGLFFFCLCLLQLCCLAIVFMLGYRLRKWTIFKYHMCKHPLNWYLNTYLFTVLLQMHVSATGMLCSFLKFDPRTNLIPLKIRSLKICPRTWCTLPFSPSYLTRTIKQRDPNLQGFRRTWRKESVVAGEHSMAWDRPILSLISGHSKERMHVYWYSSYHVLNPVIRAGEAY